MKKNKELSTGKVVPLPINDRIDLANLTDIRREMNKVYRDARRNKIDPADGSKFIFMLNAIGKIYELEVIEKKIERIDETIHSRNKDEKEFK